METRLARNVDGTQAGFISAFGEGSGGMGTNGRNGRQGTPTTEEDGKLEHHHPPHMQFAVPSSKFPVSTFGP